VSKWTNMLYFGENLDAMRKHIADESMDLIYLDPPFNSNASYSVLFPGSGSDPGGSSIKAFDDVWRWNAQSEKAYGEIVDCGPQELVDLVRALHRFLSAGDMMAYITMMATRLLELHRILKSTGTIYLHCDPTASHYMKLVMDAIFGHKNFLNEIIWHYEGPQSPSSTRFSTKHDVLLRYAKHLEAVDVVKDGLYQDISLSLNEARKKGYKTDEEGRWYYDTPTGDYTSDSIKRLEQEGRIRRTSTGTPRVKYFLEQDDHGRVVRRKKLADVWNDIPSLGLAASSSENMGYPTQKPERLLERLIRADSREGQVVFDPFCGCGTTIAVAEKMGRHWIGMDSTHLALSLLRHRLLSSFDYDVTYEVVGEPKSLQQAKCLARSDPQQYQLWILGVLGARPVKNGGQHIRGHIDFSDDSSDETKQRVIIEVAVEVINRSHVKGLNNAIEQENAALGALIAIHEPAEDISKEARAAGSYRQSSTREKIYPRIQLLTIRDIFNGEMIDIPSHPGVQHGRTNQAEQKRLF